MPDALSLTLDEDLGGGVIYSPSEPEHRMSIREVARRCWTESHKTIAAVVSYRPTYCPPAYVTNFIELEVDTWIGQVRTLQAVMGIDCGTAVNPDQVIGQMEGGLSKGAGYALYETNLWDEDGQVLSKGFLTDAKTPGMSESPHLSGLKVFFANTNEPSGPFGAKGVGEAAKNAVAAAYANAIHNALGIRFYELPITPEKILAALKTPKQVVKDAVYE
jgi:xanthine dehydrogenase molybdenum-binding subunit